VTVFELGGDLVKPYPVPERLPLGGCDAVACRLAAADGGLSVVDDVGVEVAGERFRTGELPRQIDQLPPHLEGYQTEELPWAGRGDGGESPVEPQRRPLGDVVGLAEAPDGRESAEHPPGHIPEPLGHEADELIGSGPSVGRLPGPEPVENGPVVGMGGDLSKWGRGVHGRDYRARAGGIKGRIGARGKTFGRFLHISRLWVRGDVRIAAAAHEPVCLSTNGLGWQCLKRNISRPASTCFGPTARHDDWLSFGNGINDSIDIRPFRLRAMLGRLFQHLCGPWSNGGRTEDFDEVTHRRTYRGEHHSERLPTGP